MKKRVLLLILALVALVFTITSCHKHSFEQGDIVKEATCDTAGQAKFVCSCGEEEVREIPKKGHTWGEAQVVAPLCYKDGYTYKVCTVCEAESDHTDVIAKGDDYHEYEEVYTQVADCATNQPAKKAWVCKHCKQQDPNKAVITETAEHNYEIITEPATCEKPGFEKEVCKVCEAPGKNVQLPQLDHKAELIAEAEANCDKPARKEFKCSDCGYEWYEGDGEGLGHLWSSPMLQAPTCTEPGYTYEICTRGNCTERTAPYNPLPATGHVVDYNNSEFVIRVEPTCITEGTITPICTECDEVLSSGADNYGTPYVQKIPANPELHFTEKEFVETVEATCHSDAYDVYKCTKDTACTETTKDYKKDSKLEHNYVFIKTVDPTCLDEGYDLYVCSICSTDTTENSTCELGCVDKRNIQSTVDHQAGFQDKVEATCYAKAYENHICPTCKTRYTVELADPQPEHDFSINTNNDVLPTCISEGHSVYKCKNDGCSETTQKDIKRRIAHTFEVYNDGRYVCSTCNVTYRDISTYIDKAIAEGYMPVSKVEDVVLSASKLEQTFAVTEAGGYTIIVNSALADGAKVELQVYDSVSSAWVAVDGAELEAGSEIKIVATGISTDTTVSVCRALVWELKGYGNPAEVVAIDANKPTVIYENTGSASMNKGLVKLMSSDSNAEYTVVVEYADGTVKTYTNEQLVENNDNSATGKYLDLYDYEGVVNKITVTATSGASYIICAYEG